jgi:hypothetical protein
MHLAYVHGEAVAKEYLCNWSPGQRRPHAPSEVLDFLKADSDALLKREAYLAAMDLSVDSLHTFGRLQELNERDAHLQELDKQAEADRRAFEAGAKHFQESFERASKDCQV